MSVPSAAPRGDAMSVSVIRGLLERNLVERAVALSETRWQGSGPLVRLAYEWAELPPAARRDRLAAIGPEDLSRMRGVAALQPDLARVLDDLEARGIIPPAETPVPDTDVTMTPEEAVVDAVLDVAEERASELAAQADVTLPESLDDLKRQLAEVREAAQQDQAGAPETEIGSHITSDFLAAEADRRAAATERGEEMLDRIRQQIDQASSRMSSALGEFPVAAVVPSPKVASAPVVEATAAPGEQSVDPRVRADLTNAIMSERVYEPALDTARPTDDELRGVARSLGLSFVRIDGRQYAGREVYGGLVRRGRGIVEEAGFLPRALAGRNLVVYSGRLYPTALARIDQGFFDIPGTRASTRVHPDSRLVLLGD
jgi:hypothetical protein